MKKNKKTTRSGIRKILITAMLLLILFCSSQLARIFGGYVQADRAYNSLSVQAVDISPKQNITAAESRENNISEPTEPAETAPIAVDFETLRQSSPDIIGWLYCEDTVINYPIVQSEDNDYYLYRLPDGTENSNGSLFLDFRCAGDFSDYHSIVYGHNMKSGAMFAVLDDYRKAGFYEKHPVMYLLTPNTDYELEIISGYVTPSDHGTTYSFPETDAERDELIRYALARSSFKAESEIRENTRVLTLSTCVYDYEEARYVIVAVLRPLGEVA